MCFFFTVPNLNPSLGPVQGDKQTISVYDPNLGNHRTLVATPEECDKYVSDLTNIQESGTGKMLSSMALGGGAGAVLGGGVGAIAAGVDAKKTNALVDKLNGLLKQGKTENDAILTIKNCGKLYELRNLYDESKNVFNKVTNGAKLKQYAIGALPIGLAIGITLGIVKAIHSACKKRDAVTNQFIAKHS